LNRTFSPPARAGRRGEGFVDKTRKLVLYEPLNTGTAERVFIRLIFLDCFAGARGHRPNVS
jgi:hypothetical protein